MDRENSEIPTAQMNVNLSQQLWDVVQMIGQLLIIILHILFAIVESLYRLVVPVEPISVRGKIVLITGTGHGMGKQLAILYASNGAKVIGWDVNQKLNEETFKEIESRGYTKGYSYVCDVTKRENVLQLAKDVVKTVGPIDILINNAGIMPARQLVRQTETEIEQTIKINVIAHFWLLEAFLPSMKQRNSGHIVALSSCAGLFGLRNLVPYCASKFAVRGLMEALHEELRAENPESAIRFTTIYPFIVDTGLCKRPRIRFEWFMPVLKQEEVAAAIMHAQRTGIMETTVPSYIFHLNNLCRLLPIRAALGVKRFVDAGVNPDMD